MAKRVINEKLYDTDTASEVICKCFHETIEKCWHSERIMKKKNGEFFLERVYFDDPTELVPMTEAEVKKWLGDNQIDADIYFGLFGPAEE